MKKISTIINLKTIALGLGTLSGTTLFLLYAMQFTLQVTVNRAQADTFPVLCSTTPTPTAMPTITPLPSLDCANPTPYPSPVEEIPEQFQKFQGARLAWLPFPYVLTASPTPTPPQGPPKPAVMLIHPGNWNTGDAFDLIQVGNGIAAAGYFVVAVFYRLAPPGYIYGQPCHEDDDTTAGWRMEQEVNDIKALVRALRADPRCNQKVGVVGGSAGANLAVTVALDKNPTIPNGDWPMWCQEGADDRPDCAAMLSAIYDFSDWTPTTGDLMTDRPFVRLGMENYAQSFPADLDTLANLPLNPVVLVRQGGGPSWPFKPLFLTNSYYDSPTPYHQIVTMSCELEAKGLVLGTDYQRLTIPGDGHAFAYWGSWDHESDPHKTVGEDVIAFLDAHLK